MDKQFELDMEELQIKLKKEKLQTKIAEAEARIKMLSECKSFPETPSGMSMEYIRPIPTMTKKHQTKQRIFPDQSNLKEPKDT